MSPCLYLHRLNNLSPISLSETRTLAGSDDACEALPSCWPSAADTCRLDAPVAFTETGDCDCGAAGDADELLEGSPEPSPS